MSITFQRPLLLVVTCLLASACTTEKTIVQEVPATTDAALADSTDTDTGVPATGAGTTTNTLITQTDIQVDATAPIPSEQNTITPDTMDAVQTPTVENIVAPNMVDGVLTPAVESTVVPNMVDAIQSPAVESTVAPNMVDAVQTPSVESTVAPNIVDGIQTPAVESTVVPTMVDAIQTPAVESTVAPNIVGGTQSTEAQATATGAQTPEEQATPTGQDTDLFFDPVNPDTDVSTETVTETDAATSTTTGATAEAATDATTETATGTTTGTTTGANAETPPATTTDTSTSTATATTTDFFSQNDPAAPTVIGTPGMSVDCDLTLPCRWISADAQFSVTISNADNIGEQARLSIEYSVQTSHDTEVLIASTEPAIDDTGLSYEPSALQLGEGIGGRAQGILAGQEISARIEFDRSSTASGLNSWSIGLSDAGIIRQPSFTNIPVGSATDQFADCANTLPCVWISPDAAATITLLGVTGSGSTNRLSANFKVETTTDTVVAVDSGATAFGIDGMPYRGRTHAIGLEIGAEKLTATAVPGALVAGTVHFFITQTMSTALANLSLIVYEDRPVPRWNPSFLSVPIQ